AQIETTCTFPWILIGRVANRGTKSDIAFPDGAQSHGATDPSELRGARETQFQVRCDLETDFFSMNQGPRRELVAGELPKEKVQLHWSQVAEDPRKSYRRRLRRAEHVNGLRIVAE